MRKKSQETRLDHLYQVKRKEYKRATDKLKQQIKAKAAKQYENRGKQCRQNSLFQSNQLKFYQELNGE